MSHSPSSFEMCTDSQQCPNDKESCNNGRTSAHVACCLQIADNGAQGWSPQPNSSFLRRLTAFKNSEQPLAHSCPRLSNTQQPFTTQSPQPSIAATPYSLQPSKHWANEVPCWACRPVPLVFFAFASLICQHSSMDYENASAYYCMPLMLKGEVLGVVRLVRFALHPAASTLHWIARPACYPRRLGASLSIFDGAHLCKICVLDVV